MIIAMQAPVENGHHYAHHKSSNNSSEHLKQLLHPPPTSMVLVASLQLLTAPLTPPHSVYLITPEYLQNWMIWAYHQSVPDLERARVKEILRLAAVRHQIQCPTKLDNNRGYSDPGPINSNDLSMEGHPLLLRPNAVVLAVQPSAHSKLPPVVEDVNSSVPIALRRARSLPSDQNVIDDGMGGSNDEMGAGYRACAVPELFYEVS